MVEDLAVEHESEAVRENAQLHRWPFERVGPRCFRVTLTAHNGDVYQVEVECDGFPVRPAAFHWRNQETGQLDAPADAPEPYSTGNNFFFPTGGSARRGTALLPRKAGLTKSGCSQTGCSRRKPRAPSPWLRWCPGYTTSCAVNGIGGVGSVKEVLLGTHSTVSSVLAASSQLHGRDDDSVP